MQIRKKNSICEIILMMLVMLLVMTGCKTRSNTESSQQENIQKETEFDMLVAESYMNTIVRESDAIYTYRNEFELVDIVKEDDVVILYYDWYRAKDSYYQDLLEIQLIYDVKNGPWGEPKRNNGESKRVWTLQGEWKCQDEETDIYFKVNCCEEYKIFVEYEFKNFPVYDAKTGEKSIKNLSSNGEVEMLCDVEGNNYSWIVPGIQKDFTLTMDIYGEFKISSYPNKYVLEKAE